MKTSIIEIGLPTNKLTEMQAVFEQCLQETGDLLIGRQIYADQALLVVRLFGDNIPRHLETLTPAFRNEQVDSFQIVSCHLFKVVFKHNHFEATMQQFPLHMGESWFTAAQEINAAYLCLNGPQLSQQQIAWLVQETSIAQWTNES
ncbi:MAG: hypothetical protein ACRDHZ_15240 [Ktedonobacteraceae bacterium]